MMNARLNPMEVYLASGNPHKLEEFIEMARELELKISIKSANEVGGMPDVDENGSTFEANAQIKAQALVEKVPEGAWVLADDSGLSVDALNGDPGVLSARYAGPCANATANNIKLLHEMHGIPEEERTARFSCALCFMKRGAETKVFSGTCEGHIMTTPSGEEGFGYDPLFKPIGFDVTFADLGSAIKNSLSHRGKAVADWANFVHQMTG